MYEHYQTIENMDWPILAMAWPVQLSAVAWPVQLSAVAWPVQLSAVAWPVQLEGVGVGNLSVA